MNLYEVIFYGSYGKTNGDEDTIYLVRAPDFLGAVEFVRTNCSANDHGGERGPLPHVVHELGVDASAHAEASGTRILRGPYIQCAYNYGWKTWNRKIEGAEYTKEWEEQPQPERSMETERDKFNCAGCGKHTSANSYFTLSALASTDEGKAGAGRLSSPADVVKLSLWHVVDSDMRRGYENVLAEGKFTGGQANVIFCSADCLKSYISKSLEKLSARLTKGWTQSH